MECSGVFGLDLNRKETAQALGVDPTTLDAWVAKGCPATRHGKGNPASFSLPDVITWRIAHETERLMSGGDPAELDRLRARKLELDIEAKELDLSLRRGDIANVSEIADAFRDLIVGGREYVCRVAPGRIARAAFGGSEATIRQVAQAEIEAALTDWSKQSIVDVIEGEGGRVPDGWPDCMEDASHEVA